MHGVILPNDHTDATEAVPSFTIYNVSSIADIRTVLAELHKQEALVTSQLDALVNAQKDLQREFSRLDLFRANLSTQAAKTRSISNGMLTDASTSAARISSSVKKLDLEQSRVKATLTFVEQVRELKACVLGVSGSMGAPQDWETAAGYLSRASKLPNEVIDGEFAARIVPTAEVPDAPRITLENASESLCGLFQREFENAVQENDGGKITRFFKLFPLINRSEIGLDIYGRYVCQGVAAQARTNLNAVNSAQRQETFFYANALTKLFEHIAQIIDGHGGLVERHYGPGKMARVIKRLQVEADLQAGIILDTWSDERRVDRTLTDIKSYAFTFLVQSFLPISRTSIGTARTGSPAPALANDDEGVDMRQVDMLLNEMTNMLGKWALYTRFVSEKSSTDTDEAAPIPEFLQKSILTRKVEEKLLGPFNEMTTFFFRRSVEKAFQLDDQPSDLSLNPLKSLKSTPPHVTSAVEDIIYIVKKVLQQSLATSQKGVIMSVVPTLSRVMGAEFIGMEQRKMKDESYPRAATQGALPPEQTIISFLVLINNLDVAKEYIEQIVQSRLDVEGQQSLGDLFPVPGDAEVVRDVLKSFSATFTEKAMVLIGDGIAVMYNNVLKPRLKPILLDAFRDTDYTMSAEELIERARERGEDPGQEAYSEEVRMRFQHGWDALTRPIGRLMTERTFDQLLTRAVTSLARMLELRVWTYQGRVNQAGAARLEHDVNSIIKVVVTGHKYIFRDSFLRCSQICMIMNMDDEEWEEVQTSGDNADTVADKLDPKERIRARNMLL